MNKDKAYRLLGLLLIITSLALFWAAEFSATGSALLGFTLGLGYVMLNAGAHAFDFWKSLLQTTKYTRSSSDTSVQN